MLYTRAGCHLCEQARAVTERVLAGSARPLWVVDVDSDPELTARYGHDVPVVELAGRRLARWQVDEPALRRALDRAPGRRGLLARFVNLFTRRLD